MFEVSQLLPNQDIIIPVRVCSLLFVFKMVHIYKLFSLLLLSTLFLTTRQAFTFDDSQYGVRGTTATLKNIGCNKNSLNDFSFSSSSILTCTSGSCSTVMIYLFRATHLKMSLQIQMLRMFKGHIFYQVQQLSLKLLSAASDMPSCSPSSIQIQLIHSIQLCPSTIRLN